VVPPDDTTLGETLGQRAPGESPEDAKYTTPGVAK